MLPTFTQAFYFERDDVDLKGFAKFFRDSAKEEFEHAEKFMKYQTERGGRIVLQDIKRPDKDEWGTGLDAMETALALEKTVNQALLDLQKISDMHGDYHVKYMYILGACCERAGHGFVSDVRFHRRGVPGRAGGVYKKARRARSQSEARWSWER